MILTFKIPDLTHVNIKQLMSAQEMPDEAALSSMSHVQDNVAEAVPKLADANRQDLAVLMFCLRDQVVARMKAIQEKGEVAAALCIAISATAFSKNQQYWHRYEPSSEAILRTLRCMTNMATVKRSERKPTPKWIMRSRTRCFSLQHKETS